ncbi:MAG TPA: hypothetical protein PKH77_24005 [Anaerolineae bacterium]|nr:hypothetical protein [Anaerolineae bacterium]
MTLLDSIQKDYALIDKAAAEFLSTLPGENFTRVIALAAEIAGLQLLRATQMDLSQFPPGSALLGAVSDEAYEPMQQFVYRWTMSNGLSDTGEVDVPADATGYLPEVAQHELAFRAICERHDLPVAYYPYAAAVTALKLVLAGERLKLLEPNVGLTTMVYHVIVGSKTAPCPAGAEG